MSRTNLLRIFVLLLAAGSGYAAVQLAGNVESQPAVAAAPPPAPAIDTEDVLVANKELPLGKVVAPDDLDWVAWPKKLVVEPAIRRGAAPQAREDFVGALVRSPLLKGEPVRAEKIVKANGSGFLAAMLPTGYRAIAINIDAQGSTTAGGFILPNDRVDVIRTLMRPDPQKPNEAKVDSETILGNVRVLAIGQNIQERNGERVVTGSNATLEVDPTQAELIVQAQRSGQLSLSLRSLTDTGAAPATMTGGAAPREGSPMMTVGVMRGGKRQEYTVREMPSH